MNSRSWLVAFVVAILALCAPPSRAAEPLPTIMLVPGQDAPEVAPYVRYTKDLGDISRLSPDAVLAATTRPIAGQAVHFGTPGRHTALAISVVNSGDRAGSWIFTTGRGSLTYFRLYDASGGSLRLLVDGTDPRESAANLRTYQAFSTELVLEPGERRTIVIDFLSDNSTYLPLRIETYGKFFEDRRANIAMVSGVVLGVVVLIFLNVVFFTITGHREFVWLAVAEAFFALNTVHSEGYITIFFLPDKPLLGLGIEDAIKCLFAAAMVQFARSFVGTSRQFPKLDLALKALIGAALLVTVLQAGLAIFPLAMRPVLHIATWAITLVVALLLPFVGFAAMRRIGRQLWPLLVGWGSLALFIVYAAIASMGIFTWLPINWHLAGPVGLFESIMVTLALGLNLRKIQADKRQADENYARSMAERLEITERSRRLAEEKAFALETVNSQNALLHASGHDSRQVILALKSAVEVLRRDDGDGTHRDLAAMLQSSADYLGEIVSTTMSGATIVGNESGFVALSAFRGEALVEPLTMMFKAPFAERGLTLTAEVDERVSIVSDRPVLMRAIANLLSNCYHYTRDGGARISLGEEDGNLAITIADTGTGIPAKVRAQLEDEGAQRALGGDERRGSGSGFRSARRLVEGLGGTLEIVSTGADGTVLRILLPGAFVGGEPCSAGEFDEALPQWSVVDFDRGDASAETLARAQSGGRAVAAATYDDTTVTRGRLSALVQIMLIKPLYREMLAHPAFAGASGQA